MAPSMAAVLRAPRKPAVFICFIFYLLFTCVDVVSITVYDRHMLLNIGSFVAQCKPDFEFFNAGALFTDTASEPFVWAARPRPRKRRRKRGKRAGVLVRLRCRPLRPHSQPFCWLTFSHGQQTLRIAGAHLIPTRNKGLLHYLPHRNMDVCSGSRLSHRAYGVLCAPLGRTKELTGKSRGGGVCFFINNSWCDERNLHSIKSFCSLFTL